MAQVACAVKGLTMGGSSYRGKLIMHKSYYPHIDEDSCQRCGRCSHECPENALRWKDGHVPQLSNDRCIGCGECLTICPKSSISMRSHEIRDWLKGCESLPTRMADYLIGMLKGRWARILNIAHLYNITRKCDCVDERQEPILPDIGFLIGRNPFAVDLMATYLLHEESYKYLRDDDVFKGRIPEKGKILEIYFPEYHGLEPFRYVNEE